MNELWLTYEYMRERERQAAHERLLRVLEPAAERRGPLGALRGLWEQLTLSRGAAKAAHQGTKTVIEVDGTLRVIPFERCAGE